MPRNSAGARVLRVLQKAGGERIVLGRLYGPDDALDQAGDRLDQHHRGQLAASEDVVADADLVRGEMPPHPLVEPLVASADEQEVVVARQLLDDRLGQPPALGRHENDGSAVVQIGGGADGLDGLEQRFRLHEHPRSATEGVVVYRPVTVVGMVSDVDEAYADGAAPPRPCGYTVVERAGEHLWKEGQDVETHLCLLGAKAAAS